MKRKFNFTENELHAIALVAWSKCLVHIDSINAFSKKYTAEFVNEKKIEALRLLGTKNYTMRRSEITKRRLKMQELAKESAQIWRRLKTYIEIAFPKDELSENLTLAGYAHYKLVSQRQWIEVLQMMHSGYVFLKDNKIRLCADNNMPEDFEMLYFQTMKAFEVAFQIKLNTGIDKKQNTEEHTRALNELYDELNKMFSIARLVFKNDKTLSSQFQFSSILKVVSGNGWAGIEGKVYNENGLLKNSEGLQVSIRETEEKVDLDEDSSYLVNHLAAGTYTLVLEVPGYKSIVKKVVVKVDAYSRLDFHLERIGDWV